MKVKCKTDISEYVSNIFKEEIKKRGVSITRFVAENFDYSVRGTLYNIITGKHSTNINTLAFFCDKLGLEIIIRPKEQNNDNNNEDKD